MRGRNMKVVMPTQLGRPLLATRPASADLETRVRAQASFSVPWIIASLDFRDWCAVVAAHGFRPDGPPPPGKSKTVLLEGYRSFL
jgi:hypothetical protein